MYFRTQNMKCSKTRTLKYCNSRFLIQPTKSRLFKTYMMSIFGLCSGELKLNMVLKHTHLGNMAP